MKDEIDILFEKKKARGLKYGRGRKKEQPTISLWANNDRMGLWDILFDVPLYIEKTKEYIIKVKYVKGRYRPMQTKVRDMFSYIDVCMECGSDKLLNVHHIDKNRDNNNKSNLIKLCLECHMEKHKGEPIYNLMKKRLELFTK